MPYELLAPAVGRNLFLVCTGMNLLLLLLGCVAVLAVLGNLLSGCVLRSVLLREGRRRDHRDILLGDQVGEVGAQEAGRRRSRRRRIDILRLSSLVGLALAFFDDKLFLAQSLLQERRPRNDS